jgi:hypothetical protein
MSVKLCHCDPDPAKHTCKACVAELRTLLAAKERRIASLERALERVIGSIDPDELHLATEEQCMRHATGIARAALTPEPGEGKPNE